SPTDLVGGLLRIAAYASFRNSVQQELFDQEQVLESADISRRIDAGFPTYAASFANSPKLADFENLHPFDSHPPLHQRLEAVGFGIRSSRVQTILSSRGDGVWYRKIENDSSDLPARAFASRNWQLSGGTTSSSTNACSTSPIGRAARSNRGGAGCFPSKRTSSTS